MALKNLYFVFSKTVQSNCGEFPRERLQDHHANGVLEIGGSLRAMASVLEHASKGRNLRAMRLGSASKVKVKPGFKGFKFTDVKKFL